MKSEELIREAIARYDMLADGDRVVVGFSGGSDSVCLLSALYELGYKAVAAHMNHNMRETALRDEEFCREFCAARGIPCFVKTVPKGSLKSEADARAARYAFFSEVMKKTGIDRLATAHNKNDSAETVLLHMLRGASTDGLRGILPKNGSTVRPLILVKKSEVLEYCNRKELKYMTDETNLKDIYSRNRLRNSILPMLEKEFNPRLIDAIADNALLTANDAQYLSECAKAEYMRLHTADGVETCKIRELPQAISSRIIQCLWREHNGQNLPHCYVSSVLRLLEKAGGGIDLPNSFRAEVRYGRLVIERKTSFAEYCHTAELGKWCDIPEIGARVIISRDGKGLPISLDGGEKLFVRSRKNGDKFRPYGLNGTKKLSDLFTDLKIPQNKRGSIPILCAEDKIAAVGDIRADESFAKNVKKNNFFFEILYYKDNK